MNISNITTVDLRGECPKCKQPELYAYKHCAASDVPESCSWYVECNRCTYESDDSYPFLESLEKDYNIKFYGDSLEKPKK